jgi:aspartyl-tRNA(Asn)/glutamyl-tRNA(Gln) amidotransferase subunit A
VPGAFAAALEALAGRGAEIVERELPYYAEMATATLVILHSEAFAYHRPDLATRWSDYGAATRAMLSAGIMYSAADYVQANRARRVGVTALAAAYENVDLIVTPTIGVGAISLAALADGATEEFGAIYTPYWDVTGNPVLSVPMGFTAAGLPLGLQIAGRPFEETLVLRAGDAFQRVTDWHLRAPELLTDTA